MNMILRIDGNTCMKTENQNSFREENLIEELKKLKKVMIWWITLFDQQFFPNENQTMKT